MGIGLEFCKHCTESEGSLQSVMHAVSLIPQRMARDREGRVAGM